MMGGGYLQMTVITSSPSISRPGWNLTTMSLEKTLVSVCLVPQPFNGIWILVVFSPFPLTLQAEFLSN